MHCASEMDDIYELRKRAHLLEPVVRVGKSGLTPTVIAEVQKHLRQKQLIKVRFLRSSMEVQHKKQLFAALSAASKATVVDIKGFTVTLFRPKDEAPPSVFPGGNV